MCTLLRFVTCQIILYHIILYHGQPYHTITLHATTFPGGNRLRDEGGGEGDEGDQLRWIPHTELSNRALCPSFPFPLKISLFAGPTYTRDKLPLTIDQPRMERTFSE